MSTTTRIDNYKNFDSELKIINLINSLDSTVVSLSKENIFSTQGTITKEQKKLIVEINDINFKHLDYSTRTDKIEALIGDLKCVMDSFNIQSIGTYANKSGVCRSIICTVNILKNIEFKNLKSKFKCFISTDISKLSTFHFHFETITYQNDVSEPFYDCLRLNIGDKTFDITQIKPENKGFFVIECFQQIEFEEFRDYCFSIKQALGFITAYMPGGDEYFFTDKQDFYYCNYCRPEIDSMYEPLNWNSYKRLSNKEEIAEMYRNKLTRLRLVNLSEFVSLIHTNQELSATIILLLEASSIRSLLIIPSIFSVVIESLSKIISKSESGKVQPIEDNNLAKNLIGKLNEVVDSYNGQISSNGLTKIKRRINEINRPTVKEHLTNNEKLTLPFDQLGINLSMNDINAIEHRNDLLHGNILLTNEEYNPEKETEIDSYMGYISGKLYTLISALILKRIGYEGYIINYAKFYEEFCHIETDEEYYRLI
jgi:hypothetical protein